MRVIASCCYQFLKGHLWAEILTAKVWQKSVKSWRAPIFCRRQCLWRFCMAGWYKWAGIVQERVRPYKQGSQQQHHTWWLHEERTTSSRRRTGEGGSLGEASYCGLCWVKTVRRCFCTCANILLTHMFCWHRHSVGANILPAPNFCRCLYFVGAYVLSTPSFCQRIGLRMIIYWTYY